MDLRRTFLPSNAALRFALRSVPYDLEAVGFQVLHYRLGKMRAFLRFDPVRASPIRIVFLWVAVKG